MQPIRMTRAEYEEKYGVPPPVPARAAPMAAPSAFGTPPSSTPLGQPSQREVVRMTRAEYEKKYGAPPPATQSRGNMMAQQAAAEAETPKTIQERVANANPLGIGNFARGIGQAVANMTKPVKELDAAQRRQLETQDRLIKLIKRKKEAGADTTRLETALEDLSKDIAKQGSELMEAGTGGLTNREVLGSAAKTAAVFAGGLTTGSAARAAAARQGIIGGIKTGFAEGALGGGVSGMLAGAGAGIESGKDIEGIGKSTLAGTVTGIATGGALGGALGGITGGLAARSARAKELRTLLDSNDPSVKLEASQYIREGNKIRQDPIFAEAVKQGMDEGKVAVVKTTDAANKPIFREMLQIAQKASKDPRTVERATDVSGKKFIDRLDVIVNRNKQAGKEIERAAGALRGSAVDFTDEMASFKNSLAEKGVSIKGNELDFTGSDFEDLPGVQRSIETVLKRVDRGIPDAYEAHRLKRYIDNIVEYGKGGDGMVGEAESLLKGFRRSLDTKLDVNFPEYNQANTVFKQTLETLDESYRLMGKSFKLNNPFAQVRAGSIMRRILGNSANRADLLQLINSVDKTAKQFGYNGADSLVDQIVFADLLDDVFGTQATTGLQGSVQRAIEGAGQASRVLNREGLVDKTIEAARIGREAALGINKEQRVKALMNLIK